MIELMLQVAPVAVDVRVAARDAVVFAFLVVGFGAA